MLGPEARQRVRACAGDERFLLEQLEEIGRGDVAVDFRPMPIQGRVLRRARRLVELAQMLLVPALLLGRLDEIERLHTPGLGADETELLLPRENFLLEIAHFLADAGETLGDRLCPRARQAPHRRPTAAPNRVSWHCSRSWPKGAGSGVPTETVMA